MNAMRNSKHENGVIDKDERKVLYQPIQQG